MDAALSSLSLIRCYADDGDVILLCVVCDGRLSFTNIPLGMAAECMLSHLVVNHAERIQDEIARLDHLR